jgi:prolipoprotein diacylglyceryltransferase
MSAIEATQKRLWASMIAVDVNLVAFSVGPISVRWYGLTYVVDITVGLLVAWSYARSNGG